MESTEDNQMELKYLITGNENRSDEEIFRKIIQETRQPETILDYSVAIASPKTRNYRYFDTFDANLSKAGIAVYLGLQEESERTSFLAKEDQNGYALTVKFSNADKYTFSFPNDIGLYDLWPDELRSWGPLNRARQVGRNMSLLEILRLEIKTQQFNLVQEDEQKVQLALDQVTAMGPFNIQKKFYELEIERMNGSERDLERVSSFFIDTYRDNLKLAPQAKWIKALELIRGREPKIIDSQ